MHVSSQLGMTKTSMLTAEDKTNGSQSVNLDRALATAGRSPSLRPPTAESSQRDECMSLQNGCEIKMRHSAGGARM